MAQHLQLNIGGIDYNVEVEIEEGYVVCVYAVEVCDGCNYYEVDMTEEQKQQFLAEYEDYLNDAYEEYLEMKEDIAGEEKWERKNDR